MPRHGQLASGWLSIWLPTRTTAGNLKGFQLLINRNHVLKRLVSTVRFCPSAPHPADLEIVLHRKVAANGTLPTFSPLRTARVNASSRITASRNRFPSCECSTSLNLERLPFQGLNHRVVNTTLRQPRRERMAQIMEVEIMNPARSHVPQVS